MRHHHDDGAAAPGLGLTPESTTPGGGQALQGAGERRDSGDDTADGAAAQIEKAAAGAIARAARAGVPVYRLADGTFLAVWGVTRSLPDLEAVEAFLRRVGAA